MRGDTQYRKNECKETQSSHIMATKKYKRMVKDGFSDHNVYTRVRNLAKIIS